MKRILLMDDELTVLEFLGKMLEHLQYEVVTCTEGSEAARLYSQARTEAKPFDVVILDLVILNGLGGEQAVKEIQKIDPAAKVIATSGHLDHPVMTDHATFGFKAALPKPYKMDTLRQTIAGVINS
jgi:DNA-binding NtrC family response regulator